jgi:hypothetical protein
LSTHARNIGFYSALLIAACESEPAPIDTGEDPVQRLDAGSRDAGATIGDGDDDDDGTPPGDGDGELHDAGRPPALHDAASVPADAGASRDSGTPSDGNDASLSPVGSDAATDDAGSADAGLPDPEPAIVRFVALGDGGTGDDAQKKVALAIKNVCAARGCDFALYLGDNMYETGVTSANDQQFKDKFEEPYADLDFPFYVALGNHDYGSNGSNLFPNNSQSAAQVEYTAHSAKWNLPNYYYTFRQGPIAFFVLDTNSVVLPEQFPLGGFHTPPAPADEQQAWLDHELAASDAPWKIVFGHHPYLSNGEHGNAGDYGVPAEAKGIRLKTLFEDSVCGKAQVFLSGHDHDREWLEPSCGTTFIVSGAAAKVRDMPGHGSQSRWSDATKHGFLWAEVSGDTMVGVFYDEDGQESYEDRVER